MNVTRARFPKVCARVLSDEVADLLRHAIMFGEIEPGSRLMEDVLAEEMGVSRGPIREAIRQLEQQRLVVSIPNQGARVIQPSHEDTYEVLALRVHLESVAARMAACRLCDPPLRAMADVVRRMAGVATGDGPSVAMVRKAVDVLDEEFHNRLVEASGSAVLTGVWSTESPFIWATLHFGRQQRGQEWPRSGDLRQALREVVSRHQFLLDAIASGDLDGAEAAVRCHLIDSFRDTPVDPQMLSAVRWQPDGAETSQQEQQTLARLSE